MQQDVQEFFCVLIEAIEKKMKDYGMHDSLGALFEGKTLNFIKCLNVDYRSTREETFIDVQLNVKGHRNVMESLANFIEEEELNGDNKYETEKFGKQVARKGVIFRVFNHYYP